MSKFINDDHLKGGLFDGNWTPAPQMSDVTEPATGKVLGKIGMADSAQINDSAAKARKAQPDWALASPDERAAIFPKAANTARENWDEIVTWIMRESGSVRAKAEFELSITIKAIELAGAMPNEAVGKILPSESGKLSLARRRPLGVVGVISPFNFPLYLAMRAVAPALATGNAVVLKPDPRTAICGGFIIARIFETAGLPAGLLHVLPGDGAAGAALCSADNIAMIQFTGSTSAGRKVGETASRHLKKVSLELGGKNSLIVMADADMDLALKNAAWAAFLHQGQICMTAGRIFVHESIIDEFAKKLSEKTAALPAGDPMSDQVALGPLINQAQLDHAADIIDRTQAAGAVIKSGGTATGLCLPATVLTNVEPGMAAYEEEIFGPVAVLVPFKTVDEVVAMANDTDYGLSAGILSSDVAAAMAMGDRLQTGIVHINDQTVNDDVVNPFGGVGASGNGSSIGGPANWEEFTHWQWVTIKSAPPAYPF